MVAICGQDSAAPPWTGRRLPGDVDITRDVNGDSHDDLVLPDADGFWVFIQTENGAFAEPAKVGPPADMSGI